VLKFELLADRFDSEYRGMLRYVNIPSYETPWTESQITGKTENPESQKDWQVSGGVSEQV